MSTAIVGRMPNMFVSYGGFFIDWFDCCFESDLPYAFFALLKLSKTIMSDVGGRIGNLYTDSCCFDLGFNCFNFLANVRLL
jgi:hypothetical protein